MGDMTLGTNGSNQIKCDDMTPRIKDEHPKHRRDGGPTSIGEYIKPNTGKTQTQGFTKKSL